MGTRPSARDVTGHPRSAGGAAAINNDTPGTIYHVVRTRWFGEGKVVDTRSHDWRSSLGLHGERLAACELVAALYRHSGDTLSAIVTLGWHAFTARDTVEQAYREYVDVGGRGLEVRDVKRFVTSIGRYNPTFRDGMDGLRIRETIFGAIRARFHPGSHYLRGRGRPGTRTLVDLHPQARGSRGPRRSRRKVD
jgi:hypothetical protein